MRTHKTSMNGRMSPHRHHWATVLRGCRLNAGVSKSANAAVVGTRENAKCIHAWCGEIVEKTKERTICNATQINRAGASVFRRVALVDGPLGHREAEVGAPADILCWDGLTERNA